MLADSVPLFSSHPCELTAHAAMQEAVIRVAEWNRQLKMTFSTEMCEVACFTSNLHEALYLGFLTYEALAWLSSGYLQPVSNCWNGVKTAHLG